MNFARYFKLSSYCLITSGFVAIAATGALDLFSLCFFAAALAVSWFLDTERLRRRLPVWVLNLITLSYFPIYLADYLLFSRSFVVSTVHLILFGASVKLLTRATDRDFVYLYLISFAELLAASTLTIDITFAFLLFFFLLSGVCTLILFEMKRSHAEAQKQGKIQPLVLPESARGTGYELFSRFPAGSVSWISLGMTLTILALALPLFLLLPRISLGIYSRPSARTQMVSGFSETVLLGEIGTIKGSPEVVMRVKLTDPPAVMPVNLKWRGVALDHYDGRSWNRSRPGRRRLLADKLWYRLENSRRGAELWQTYLLEALSTNVVFTSHKALAISGDLGRLERDSYDSLYTARHPFNKIRYIAVSDVAQPDPAMIPQSLPPVPDPLQRIYLQIPDLDPRIATLAREVTREVRHPYGKAVTLEKFLKTNYGYSLELSGSPQSRDPLATFLFDVRRGHCEYFATAMAIMLRQIGIPARLVNGFRSGEYNSIGEAWTVRQYDAHSWVEAYLPPYEWIEFDPTPPDPERTRSTFLKIMGDLVDAVDLWWTEEVVNYDFLKQYRLISAARTRVREWQRGIKSLLADWRTTSRSTIDRLEIRGWLSAHRWTLGAGAFLAAALYFILFHKGASGARRLWLMLRRALSGGDPAYVVTSFYREASTLLRAHGLARARSQTPLEFARSLDALPVAPPMKALTVIYNRIRFGAQQTADDTAEAEALLKSLRIALKHRD